VIFLSYVTIDWSSGIWRKYISSNILLNYGGLWTRFRKEVRKRTSCGILVHSRRRLEKCSSSCLKECSRIFSSIRYKIIKGLLIILVITREEISLGNRCMMIRLHSSRWWLGSSSLDGPMITKYVIWKVSWTVVFRDTRIFYIIQPTSFSNWKVSRRSRSTDKK